MLPRVKMTTTSSERSLAIDSDLKTPTLFLYSRSGSIPYLSWNFINQTPGVIFSGNSDAIGGDRRKANFVKLNVADFVNNLTDGEYRCDWFVRQPAYFDGCKFILTLFDPLQKYRDYKCTDDCVAVHSIHGKQMVSVSQLETISKSVGAKYCQSLAVINTPPAVGKKWTNKAVARTMKFLDDTVSPNSTEERKQIWATLTGGYSSFDRAISAKKIAEFSSKLSGVIIDGFFGYQSEIEAHSYQKCKEILTESVLCNLPESLPRALWGAFLPDDMLGAIRDGIDILDTSICTLLSEKGFALPSPLIDMGNVKLRFSRTDGDADCLLDLNAECHREEVKRVISDQCECHTCSGGFTRAYINHMLKRSEMNGTMLLQIHNHFTLTHFMFNIHSLLGGGLFHTLLVNSRLL